MILDSPIELVKEAQKDKALQQMIEVERVQQKLIEALVNARKNSKITQKEIADKTGMSQQAVDRMEKYGYNPTVKNLIKYLMALNVDANCLLHIISNSGTEVIN